jgi:hypothetical protein
MSPHASIQTFMASMNYAADLIEDRAAAFGWLLENVKAAEWPAYLDVPLGVNGRPKHTNCMFRRWRFVDLGDDGIVFTNFTVPSITRDEFAFTIEMNPEIQK